MTRTDIPFFWLSGLTAGLAAAFALAGEWLGLGLMGAASIGTALSGIWEIRDGKYR